MHIHLLAEPHLPAREAPSWEGSAPAETAVTLLWETLVWIICVFPFKNVSSRDRTMRKALVLKCISFSLIGKQSPWAAQELV